MTKKPKKIFIFEYVRELTGNFHSGGGLVVIAENLERAIQMAKSTKKQHSYVEKDDFIELDDEEIKNVSMYDLQGEVEEKLMIFPDAGCC
jgi:hypothetical protein